jgi:hypothetical protein
VVFLDCRFEIGSVIIGGTWDNAFDVKWLCGFHGGWSRQCVVVVGGGVLLLWVVKISWIK